MKKFWFAIIVLALVFSVSQPVSAADQPSAPIVRGDAAKVIPGRYIVVLNASAKTESVNQVAEAAESMGAKIYYRYDAALVGFAAEFSDQALASLAKNSTVAYIEADQVVTIDGTQPSPPSWGLDRIDQRNLPLNSTYTYNFTGAGVHAYIIDTGINITHNEFGGRALGRV